MLFSEMKTIFPKENALETTFHLLLIILIITTSGQCVPRQSSGTGRTQDEFKRKATHGILNAGDNSLESDIALPSKNKILSHNTFNYREDRARKERTVMKGVASLGLETRKYADPEWDVDSLHRGQSVHLRSDAIGEANVRIKEGHDKADLRREIVLNDSDSLRLRRKESLLRSSSSKNDSYAKPHGHLNADKNLQEEETLDNDEDFITDEPRIDIILNDLNLQKATGSETIIDYFFVSDAGDPNHLGVPKHGVIINLRGLIPAEVEDDEDDVTKENLQDHEHDERKTDDVLAFKAFEISSSPLSADPGRLLSEFDDQFVEEAVNVKGHRTLTSSNAPLLESRNLSRKRRQKASPNQEDATDRQRRGYFRRRRRKRKRRLRHSPKASEGAESDSKSRRAEVVQEDLFLLRSNSPAYVITSANEVKKDWCRTVPLKQKIVEANCRPRVLMNHFCYGQCNSFFIPHSGRTGSAAAFQSCAFCKPHKSRWTTVTLHCPGQTPPRIEKRVLMVESCRCKTEILQ